MAWIRELLAVATIVLIGAVWFVYNAFNQPDNRSEYVSVVVERGAGSRQVAEELTEAGVISHPLLFRFAARLTSLDKHLKAGEYRFAPKLSMRQVLDITAKGEVFYRMITLPEGLTTAQMIEIIRTEPNLSGEVTIEPIEGEMLPETYSFTKGESRDILIERTRKAMSRLLDEAWKQNHVDVLKNKYELLILASIVEKETGIPEERADVAAVFVNRLQKGMKLQTDPTVIYALTLGESDLGRPLYKKDLMVDSAYNTYRYYGLPPTPICNPGKDAIWATINPSKTDYLYFVASGEGGHRFAKSLDDHNRNVELYRRALTKI